MSVPVPGEPRRLSEMPTKGRVVVAGPDSEAAAIKGARDEGCDYFLTPWVEQQVFWIDIDAAMSAFEGSPDGLARDAAMSTTDPLRDERLYQFEKGWRVALGYIRREGLAFFEHAEGALAEMLAAEAIDLAAARTARLVTSAAPSTVRTRAMPTEPSGSTGAQPSAEAIEAENARLRKLIEPNEWLGWDQVDSIYDEARLLRRERDEARSRLSEAHAAGVAEGRAALRDEIRAWARCQLPQHYDDALLGGQIADLIEARFPSEGTT